MAARRAKRIDSQVASVGCPRSRTVGSGRRAAFVPEFGSEPEPVLVLEPVPGLEPVALDSGHCFAEPEAFASAAIIVLVARHWHGLASDLELVAVVAVASAVAAAAVVIVVAVGQVKVVQAEHLGSH